MTKAEIRAAYTPLPSDAQREGYSNYERPCFDEEVCVLLVDPRVESLRPGTLVELRGMTNTLYNEQAGLLRSWESGDRAVVELETGGRVSVARGNLWLREHWVRLCDLEPGDFIQCASGKPAQVMRVTRSAVHDEISMCQAAPGLWLTPGHPLQYDGASGNGGRWMRPSEIFPVVKRRQEAVYNLYVDPSLPIIICTQDGCDRQVAASLGHPTPGITGGDKDGWLQGAFQMEGVCDWLRSFAAFHVHLTYRGSRADFEHFRAMGCDTALFDLAGPLAVRMAKTRMCRARALQGVVRCEVIPQPSSLLAAQQENYAVFLVASTAKSLGAVAALMNTNAAATDIAVVRQALPIYAQRAQLLQAAEAHDVFLVMGATGSGKTTQLPQYLWEAGYSAHGVIGCTQPRRVAARRCAERVAEEMGCALGAEVGYTVRFENKTSERTRIKYMTDGILSRELLKDRLLRAYAVIVLDEAHMRSLTTEVMMPLLRTCVEERRADPVLPNLKLLVTSATLNAAMFSSYFGDCPVFDVPGRLHPITWQYEPIDAGSQFVQRAVERVLHIHRTQPAGDILVFLTGEEDIEKAIALCTRAPSGEAGLALLPLPLFGKLTSEQQDAVFRPTPAHVRKVIFSTNIAETSITVDGIVYVVDSGLCKQKSFSASTGTSSLQSVLISKADARQRAGRAGRTQPGSYHALYSQQTFETTMLEEAVPEIHRLSLSALVLHLSALGINVDVFAFLDPPPPSALTAAKRQLCVLGAIAEDDALITPLGRRMAALPLAPELAKLLLAGEELGVVNDCLAVTALLSAQGNAFHCPRKERAQAQEAQAEFASPLGDHITLLRVYQAWTDHWYACGEDADASWKWCRRRYVNYRTMVEAWEIWFQLACVLQEHGITVDNAHAPPTKRKARARPAAWLCACGLHNPGSATSCSMCRADRAQGEQRQAAVRAGLDDQYTAVRRAIAQSCFMNAAQARSGGEGGGGGACWSLAGEYEVHIHPASVLFSKDRLPPPCLIFHEVLATTRSYIRHSVAIEAEWLPELAPHVYVMTHGFVLRKDYACELLQFTSDAMLRHAIGPRQRVLRAVRDLPGMRRAEVLGPRRAVFLVAVFSAAGGGARALQEAVQMLQEAAHEKHHEAHEFAFPQATLPTLVGVNGAHLQELTQLYGCELTVTPGGAPGLVLVLVKVHRDDWDALRRELVRCSTVTSGSQNVEVDRDLYGAFVGKGRGALQDITNESGADLLQCRTPAGHTVFRCKGTPLQVAEGMQLLRARLALTEENKWTVAMLDIPSSRAPLLVGAKGSTIQQLIRDSGVTSIGLPKDSRVHGRYPSTMPVTIRGGKAAVALAVARVRQHCGI